MATRTNVFKGDRFFFQKHINEFIIKREDSEAAEVFLVIIPAQHATHTHSHDNCEQIFFVIEGAGILTHGHESHELQLGKHDVVHIPRNEVHSVRATSEKGMIYLCVDAFPVARDGAEGSSVGHAQAVMEGKPVSPTLSKVDTTPKQRPIIVTGGTSPLGQRLTRELLEQGWTVISIDRELPAEGSLAAWGERFIPLACNVAEEGTLQTKIEHTLQAAKLPLPRALFCISDQANPKKHLFETDVSFFRQHIETTLTGALNAAKSFATLLRATSSSGAIWFVSSTAEREPRAYDITNGGLEALARTIALDLSPCGITANTARIGHTTSDANAQSDICAILSTLAVLDSGLMTGQTITLGEKATA